MKIANILVAMTALIAGMSFSAKAQSLATTQGNEADVFVPIGKYIQQGNADRLSAWFADNLEVTILGNSNDCCSKNQAKEIMQAFFDANRPYRFNIIHKSGESIMKHAIGRLYCNQSNYSVTISVMIGENGNHIQILRIDNE
ncbi:MAG: DUF4783 domain-containing protein [Muribaculum sp.]|uniref:DUF4783 domain-containing protein n=1 Tax=Candidatus Merdivivens faecigallinarum TaxID=2840871 RepID=A0A9D9NPV3_9BACT|nr:DUF4783 domain-containing protein [Candidatus Merdivivens faecigallinarum]